MLWMMNKTYVSTPNGVFIKAPGWHNSQAGFITSLHFWKWEKNWCFERRTHPEAERIAMKEVKTRWESGNPVTRPEVYNLLRNSYDPSTSFHKLLGSVASIHMMKEGKCFLRTWRLWMTTLSIKVCSHQTKLIGTESFAVLDTVYHFITTTFFCFCSYPFP